MTVSSLRDRGHSKVVCLGVGLRQGPWCICQTAVIVWANLGKGVVEMWVIEEPSACIYMDSKLYHRRDFKHFTEPIWPVSGAFLRTFLSSISEACCKAQVCYTEEVFSFICKGFYRPREGAL